MNRTTIDRATNRTDWLKQRQPFFNASAAACLWDRHPYMSAADYAVKKLTGVDNDNETSAMRRGTYLEDGIAQWWAIENGVTVTEPPVLFAAGPILATVDRIVQETLKPVEIKTASGYHDEPVPYWLDQCQAIMLCHGSEMIDLVWVDSSLALQSVTVAEDTVFQADLLARADRFMAAVEMGITPDWIVPELTAAHVAALHPDPGAGSVELSAANVASLHRYAELKAIVKEADTEMDEIKDHVARALADHDTGTFEGEPVVTWKASKAGVRFDEKAFREEHPDTYQTYTVERPGSRRFLPK